MFTKDLKSEQEKKTNFAKYLSNSITITSKHVLPTLFTRYYSWLTNSLNLYNLTAGVFVNTFNIFGINDVNPRIPAQKNLYVNAFETISYGIIKSVSKSEKLSLVEYIKYQVEALEKLFKVPVDTKNVDMNQAYIDLFKILDLDKDGKLGISDLTVSLAYLDMQDSILNGKLRYEDAINLGQNIETEVGRFKMRLELNNLKEFLYN